MPGSCGIPFKPSAKPCAISAQVRNRSGQPRWWCSVHGCEAWGPGGVRLASCRGSDVPPPKRVLVLDPTDYAGGVGLWGATKPVYSWGLLAESEGIHVHARWAPGGPKVVDDTFDEVRVVTPEGLFRVTADMAHAYLVSRTLGLPMKALRCRHCDELHLDMFEFALTNHRKHQCNSCGRSFWDREPSIANPCVDLQRLAQQARPTPVQSSRRLDLQQRDLTALAVWGSNEAIIWTASSPEEMGIHVHAANCDGKRCVDETYGTVTIDDIELDPTQVRMRMVQTALPFLTDRVLGLICSSCNTAHFDDGLEGVRPTSVHECHSCGRPLIRTKKRVVSNPIVRTLEDLAKRSRGRRQQQIA